MICSIEFSYAFNVRVKCASTDCREGSLVTVERRF